MALTYRDAGVDMDEGDRLVELIKPLARPTLRPEVLAGIGGFGGLFALDLAKWREPVLVSGTDGVGTKLKIAFAADRHDTIGQDLVAMCVNDVAVVGAEPLFFLDYFATGKLAADQASLVVKGIAHGCTLAGCALIGGETAELPGFYAKGEYDLAGFAVGCVERARRTLGEALLEPTRIYAKDVLALLETVPVKAFAHVTGGGLPGNVPRTLPDGVRAVLEERRWPRAAIFDLVARPRQLDRRRDRARRRRGDVRGRGVIRIAVLASGGGTNLQALIDGCAARRIDAEIAV